MCVNTVLELTQHDEDLECIFDFGAGKGDIGRRLVNAGLRNLYGHDGSLAKKTSLMKQGSYREVTTYIVGKQNLPKQLKRKFDVVTCSENLGTHQFPAKCFEDMISALKPRGYAVFTVATKHLNADS